MEQIVIKGKIKVVSECEPYDGLYIGEDLLSSELEYLSGKQVSVRYWISDKELNKDELVENTLKSIFGSLEAYHHAVYSDVTGYLWTNDELSIGGHDLVMELSSYSDDYIDKYAYIEIDVHECSK